MKKNIPVFVVFTLLFYGLWMLVFPVFFFLPLILLLLYGVQQQFTGPLALRATLSVLCALPYLLREQYVRLAAGGEEPVLDLLLLLTWMIIFLYWVAALSVAVYLRRAGARLQ